MGVGPHTPGTHGRKGAQLWDQRAVFVKQLLRTVAAQPGFQLLDPPGFAVVDGDGDLMGLPAALRGLSVHGVWAGPPLGRGKHDHGPAGTGGVVGGAGILLNTLDLAHGPVQRGGHLLVHGHGVAALYETGLPAAALEEHLRLLVGDPGKDGGIGDFKAVQMKNGQHRAVADGVEKFVGVPCGGQTGGLCLAVSHHAGGDEIGVVHDRAKGVGQGVAQLAPLIDGARSLRGHMGGDAAGEGELLEQALHALGVLTDIGVDLAVGAVQIVLGHHGAAAVTGTGQIDHIQVVFDNSPVQMGINEVLSGTGAPVAHNILL